MQAQGNVTSEVKAAPKLVSQQADVVLNAKSQPQSAVLTGGVQYSSNLPLLQRSAKAEEATIAFDAQGQASNAVFTGAVHMNERTRATEAAREPWSSRDLTAAKVEAALVPVNGYVPSKGCSGNRKRTSNVGEQRYLGEFKGHRQGGDVS